MLLMMVGIHGIEILGSIWAHLGPSLALRHGCLSRLVLTSGGRVDSRAEFLERFDECLQVLN